MELEAERANIDKGIARELISDPTLEWDQIVFFLERFRKGDPNDEAYRLMLVDTFLNSVFLYDDGKMVIVLNYCGEHSKVTLSTVEKAVDGGTAECSSIAPPSAPNGANLNHPMQLYFFKKAVAVVFRFAKTR